MKNLRPIKRLIPGKQDFQLTMKLYKNISGTLTPEEKEEFDKEIALLLKDGIAMERGKFKKILPKHFDTCKKLIEAEGKCIETNVKCMDCPFSSGNNAVTGWNCWSVGYSDIFSTQEQRMDETLIRNCKAFIKEFFGELI